MLTVGEHGWSAVRSAVFGRDGGCIATQPRIFGRDVADDQCRDQWGTLIEWDDWEHLEFDHIKQDGVRYDDEAHGVTVCPWHHRLSQKWRVDSRLHRGAVRRWLAKHWPDVWGSTDAQS